MKWRNQSVRKASRIDSWTEEDAIQYRLKAAGKVICTGILINGIIIMYLRILRKVGLLLFYDVFKMLSMLRSPPMTGSTLNGSGELKSLNQRKPSVNMPGWRS